MNPHNDNDDSIEHATVAHYVARRRNRNTLLLAAIANVEQYNMSYVDKIPCRTSALTGWAWIMELLSNKTRCHENLRMSRELFLALCGELVNKYGLEVPEKGVRVEESVAIFLQAIGMAKSNRQLCEDFQHSGEIISQKFGEVLEAVKLMAADYCRPTRDQNDVHPYVRNTRRYHPFKVKLHFVGNTFISKILYPYPFTVCRTVSGLLMGHTYKQDCLPKKRCHILVEKGVTPKILWLHVILICVLHLFLLDGKVVCMTRVSFTMLC